MPAISHEVAPPLTVRAQGSGLILPAGPVYWIGRDPTADIVVDEPLVSWQHAILTAADGRWLLEDADSTNGIYTANGQRVRRVEITSTCRVRLGHPDAGPILSCSTTGAPQTSVSVATTDKHPSAVMRLPATRVVRIGRSDDNDIVVKDLRVSRHHAELRRTQDTHGKYQIIDLNSHNGTFLNGQRVTTAPVTEQDVVGIGLASFRLVGDELQEFVDTGDVSLTARNLTVTLPNGKVLLDDVSFSLGERCLLGALTGTRPATEGSPATPARPNASSGSARCSAS